MSVSTIAEEAQTWTETSDPASLPVKPVVSVIMLAFNHGACLAEAIQGVASQQTDFPIELVIGEDCSPANTRELALEHQRRLPHLIGQSSHFRIR